MGFPKSKKIPGSPRAPNSAPRLFTDEKKAEFLEVLAETGSVTQSLEKVNITRQTAYAHKTQHPEFREQWDAAMEVGLTRLEDEALRRGADGVDRAIFQGGVQVGTERVYSDALLMFLMKGRAPHKYARNEVTGANGGPLQAQNTNVNVAATPQDLSSLSTEDLVRLYRERVDPKASS